MALPPELVHAIQQAQFLHVLATNPSKLIPSGKSLLSMLTSAHVDPSIPLSPQTPQQKLKTKVEQVVHKAFWDEALETLSSAQPPSQITRLKALYADLYDTLVPLFPPGHPILQMLSSPLSPTSSPLHSAIEILTEVISALKQRCAPVRDPELEALHDILAAAPPLHPSSSDHDEETSKAQRVLAGIFIETTKSLISLAEVLKSDLTQAVLGAMTDSQLLELVRQQARLREREIVLQLWAGHENVTNAWKTWVEQLNASSNVDQLQISARKHWTMRLIRAIGATTAISCRLPSTPVGDVSLTQEGAEENSLPPPFYFSLIGLFYLQNYLQALIIVASLRPQTHLPMKKAGDEHAAGSDFTARVWTLLESEIDKDFPDNNTSVMDNGDPTRIINLADEVIRARRLHRSSTVSTSGSKIGDQEEREIRTAVERTLQYNDPVWALLQSRVLRVLEHDVIEALDRADSEKYDEGITTVNGIPRRMRTGRGVARSRFSSADPTERVSEQHMMELVNDLEIPKGFEDPILSEKFRMAVVLTLKSVEWIEDVWRDVIY